MDILVIFLLKSSRWRWRFI